MFRTIERQRSRVGLPERSIILSFDDGPASPAQTGELLHVLEHHQVRAVFCLVGHQVAQRPDLCREIHASGHYLVNHTYSHRSTLKHASDDELIEDIRQGDTAIGDAIGEPQFQARYVRPPGGMWHGRLKRVLEQESRLLMPITFFCWDTMSYPGVSRVLLQTLFCGAIRDRGGLFLIHEQVLPMDGREASPNDRRSWLPGVIGRFIWVAKKEGYTFPDPRGVFEPNEA